MNNNICIVQARMTSTRLPGKVLASLEGKTIIEHVYERLSESKKINEIVFAIPDSEENRVLEEFLSRKKIKFFLGSEENVLERFYKCAEKYNADIVIRVTCDNPLVDYEAIDLLIDELEHSHLDYITTEGLPLGCSTEVFTFQALETAFQKAGKDYEKEHVTPYIFEHPESFKVEKMNAPAALHHPGMRFTVDTGEDLKLMKAIYHALYRDKPINLRDVIELVLKRPELMQINAHIRQKKFKE